MEDQILGHKGTMNLTSGKYYFEDENTSKSGIEQLLSQIGDRLFSAIPAAGPSWRPEMKQSSTPHYILEKTLATMMVYR